MRSSLDSLSPELQKQYRNLNIFAFTSYIFYAFYYVFQPIYFVSLNFSLTLIFINAGLAPIFSLLFQNYWSKLADQTQRIKRYILLGNAFFIVVAVITIYVNSFGLMLLLTLINNISPNSDYLANVLVYKLSDRVTGISADPVEKQYHNINLFARYRRYGSIGFAFGLPILGYFLTTFHLSLSIPFWACAIGLIFVSLWFYTALKEEIIMLPPINPEKPMSETKNNTAGEIKPKKSSLWQNYRRLFANRIFMGFIIATLFFYTATSVTDYVQGLFYNVISHNNWFELVWIFSIAALIEWPVMTIVAKQVKKIGWEKMIMIVYILTGIRLTVMPLIFIFNGAIYWGYLLQLFSGTLFGLNWPTTTFGLYISLPEDQKTIGQTFFGTGQSIANCIGMMIAAIIAAFLVDPIQSYMYLHWFAGIVALCAGILFLITVVRFKRNISKPKYNG